jgi:hypothetical protein
MVLMKREINLQPFRAVIEMKSMKELKHSVNGICNGMIIVKWKNGYQGDEL